MSDRKPDLDRELTTVAFLIDTAIVDTRSPNFNGTQAGLHL